MEDLVEQQLRVTGERIDAATSDNPERLSVAAAREADLDRAVRSSFTDLPITWVRDRLGLTATEERVLWVLIAHELSPPIRHKLRALNTEHVSDVTLDTLRRVVYGAGATLQAWREIGPDGVLRRLALIERTDGTSDAPEQRQTFKVARRVLALVHGEVAIDSDVAQIATLSMPQMGLESLEIACGTLDRVRGALADHKGFVVVHGRTGTGRRSVAIATARAMGLDVMTIDATTISTQRDIAQRQLRLVHRECRLLSRVPLFRHLEALGGVGEVPDRLDLFETEIAGTVLATANRPVSRRWRRPPTIIELPAVTGAQRAKLWSRALPPASSGDADLLATMYPLAPALIHAVGEVAMRQCGDGNLKPAHIEAGIRSVLDDRLAGLATRITVTQQWDDLILPDDQNTAIVELLARIRERRRVYEEWGFGDKVGKGLGVSALFSGPPGTGKTMAAGLIARDLNVELYQVDLSKIVSKWIGETEKNLAALFDAAEAGHAILLFDEAEALFGKRTSVQSSNDRHSNQETNYLLQRMESFTGICILTTNHETGLDEAFRRRLSLHVRFPVPEADERKRLWRALIPKAAPVAPDAPFDRLAETFVMSGGYIRNAVLRAAFLAAEGNGPITAAHLARAAQLEYEAMGKIVSAS